MKGSFFQEAKIKDEIAIEVVQVVEPLSLKKSELYN
jgi:hypothetical protein